jgi:hypothetical protein
MGEVTYYVEPNGDYLAVYPSTGRLRAGAWLYDGRASAFAGVPCSVASVSVAQVFLDLCREVDRSEVPEEWLGAIG